MKNVIVILGPTAVGKSDFAILLAQKLCGEIISADATQVYRGLNIGSAKQDQTNMKGITHHLINIKDFDQTFNAFMFVDMAKKLIDEIILRGNTPIIVGGTNLYISALVNNYAFEKAGKQDVPYKSKFTLKFHLFALNIEDRAVLYSKINQRVDKMLENGFVDEVKALKQQGLTIDMQSGKAIGYRELLMWLDGKIEYDEAVDKIKQHSRNFAKRQLTWLRSIKNLVWLEAGDTNNLETVRNCINLSKI